MSDVKVAGPSRRHRFGAHLSVAGGVHHALEAARALRCDVVQVFVKNQRQWRAPPLDPAEVRAWHELLARPGFGPAVAHASYLINLASSNRTLWARSRAALGEELRRCHALKIPYLVVHPGSAGEARRTPALARVARAVGEAYARHAEVETLVLLETTAGQGTTLGASFAELGEIMGRVDRAPRVGVCIDTCHVFAAGYDIRDAGAYRAMIAEAERDVGLERVRCWHLNDSRGACGGRVDRHAHIGHGQLGVVAFRNVLSDARFFGLPMILETPKGTDASGRDWDRINLRRLRAISRAARA